LARTEWESVVSEAKTKLKGSRAQEEEDFKTPNEVLCHFLCINRVMICD
jgi:hypothetical protein